MPSFKRKRGPPPNTTQPKDIRLSSSCDSSHSVSLARNISKVLLLPNLFTVSEMPLKNAGRVSVLPCIGAD